MGEAKNSFICLIKCISLKFDWEFKKKI